MDPVLDMQQVMNGGAVDTAAPPAARDEGVAAFTGSRKVPNLLAGMVIGSVVTLTLLRAAGIRFSFGANIGG
jgi:hypothetical protein